MRGERRNETPAGQQPAKQKAIQFLQILTFTIRGGKTEIKKGRGEKASRGFPDFWKRGGGKDYWFESKIAKTSSCDKRKKEQKKKRRWDGLRACGHELSYWNRVGQ